MQRAACGKILRPTCGRKRHDSVECGGGLHVSQQSSRLTCPSPVYYSKGLDRRVGRAMFARACSDVTNGMQLHTFARLFQDQHRCAGGLCIFVRGLLLLCSILTCCRPIWCQTESMSSSGFEAAQISVCCWGRELGSWTRGVRSDRSSSRFNKRHPHRGALRRFLCTTTIGPDDVY